jgi:hypothetical protein
LPVLPDTVARLIATLATAVWRIHKRLTTENSLDDAARIRGAIRHAEAALDSVRGNGLAIRDYIGERYKPGLDDVSVLSREPDPRYAVEMVIQAQRPAVRLEGFRQLLQRAEVVISEPGAEPAGKTPVPTPNDSASDEQNAASPPATEEKRPPGVAP